jgi:hypothetical protein
VLPPCQPSLKVHIPFTHVPAISQTAQTPRPLLSRLARVCRSMVGPLLVTSTMGSAYLLGPEVNGLVPQATYCLRRRWLMCMGARLRSPSANRSGRLLQALALPTAWWPQGLHFPGFLFFFSPLYTFQVTSSPPVFPRLRSTSTNRPVLAVTWCHGLEYGGSVLPGRRPRVNFRWCVCRWTAAGLGVSGEQAWQVGHVICLYLLCSHSQLPQRFHTPHPPAFPRSRPTSANRR